MKRIQTERFFANRYNHLLIVLILLFFTVPFVGDRYRILNVSLMAIFFLGTTLIALRAAIQNARVYYFWVLVACLTLAAEAAGNTSFARQRNLAEVFRVIAFLSFVGYLSFAVGVLLKKIFIVRQVTIETIKEGICVYLLLGIIWACFYMLVILFDPQAFSAANPSLFYFSFTTLTTTGYGDIVPVHPMARVLSNLEGLVGQIYLAIFVARLVGLYIVQEMTSGNK
jgi:hypothetical protein